MRTGVLTVALLALVVAAPAAQSPGRIEADPKVIGERPCGETPLEAPIVQSPPPRSGHSG